jgi:hypothetical protein
MGGWYILVNREPVRIDPREWSYWRAMAGEEGIRVAKTEFPSGLLVSTVFLGLDHNHWPEDDSRPILFETMCFVPDGEGREHEDVPMIRYRTWAEAEAGHAEVVKQAEQVEAQGAVAVDALVAFMRSYAA